jgi:hypothetical protein
MACSTRSLVAVCVAGLLLSACGASEEQDRTASLSVSVASDGNSVPLYTRTAWRLASVNHAGKTVAIPPAWDATLKFRSHRGVAMFDDTVNTTSGNIALTDAGYVISEQVATAVGYAGSDPKVRLVIGAMAAASGTAADASASSVRAKVVANQLALYAQGYKLTFDRF